ncbi:MAG: hypothetical protein WBY88_16695 [Desulfosarcina sp.]
MLFEGLDFRKPVIVDALFKAVFGWGLAWVWGRAGLENKKDLQGERSQILIGFWWAILDLNQ